MCNHCGIWEQGSEVVKTKVAYFASDEEATRYERFLIGSLGDLTNVQGGTDQFTNVTIKSEDQRRFGASIRRVDPDGREYWSAREVANYLGYASWASFQKVFAKAEKALTTVGMDPSQEFHHTVLPVLIGYDASRDLADVHLSRVGFLLAVQSADPAKSMVRYGKAYIAQQMLRGTAAEFMLRPVEECVVRPLVSYRARQKLRQAEEPNHD